MKKYKSLVMALCCLGILMLITTPSFAVVIDVSYYWYTTGGTQAISTDPSQEFIVGDISGTAVVKIQEMYKTDGHEYSYTLSNLAYNPISFPYVIQYFAVANPETRTAADWREGPLATSWSSWDPTHTITTPSEWKWTTSTFADGVDGAGSVNNFRIYPIHSYRSIVDGTVKFYDSSGSVYATYTGKVSGPVPEPTSLLLLGSGLLGVALVGVRKRKI